MRTAKKINNRIDLYDFFLEHYKIKENIKTAKESGDLVDLKRLNKIKKNYSFMKLAKQLGVSRAYIYYLYDKFLKNIL